MCRVGSYLISFDRPKLVVATGSVYVTDSLKMMSFVEGPRWLVLSGISRIIVHLGAHIVVYESLLIGKNAGTMHT